MKLRDFMELVDPLERKYIRVMDEDRFIVFSVNDKITCSPSEQDCLFNYDIKQIIPYQYRKNNGCSVILKDFVELPF